MPTRILRDLEIENTYSWDFFTRLLMATQLVVGGCILHISEIHHYTYRVGLGMGTNNFAEVMALKLLVHFAVEKDIKRIQIYGDSLIIINWAKRT